jgi:fructose/tagatose bisphosphate aldolase
MPLVPFSQLMVDAEAGGYAVGYFESWNLESLLAVADAARAARSPVILGFSGIYLTHPGRAYADGLSVYAAMGLEVCRRLSVPACLLFNESPQFDSVLEAVDLGFNLVMFSDEQLAPEETVSRVKQVCAKAHPAGAAVEAEMAVLPGMGRQVTEPPADFKLTDAGEARRFVAETGVDALAVNIGQVHLHGRKQVRLDLDRLTQLRAGLHVPLVLHGASSVERCDLAEAARRGIRKINVGSILKQTWFRELSAACRRASPEANPYEIIGSGLPADVMTAGRAAMQKLVVDLMGLFGSEGRAAD